ncbi:PDZ domain-containing protein [Nonomuraea phyllanthi]|uniref:PDZ domain-containing protein n=1 Tax=Nonomuraea phyllanthi TaxID=2219224 RepID=A0A5C4VTG3_9ACTN|nr:trypsin-like peptidase domain-containing protein [Nonomuraea phyllanthi]KAB8190117.1 PDZ domain-containing protein [Nonomuraea phyllanthi]QFY08612.1 PDZ domain-containing protein [Nonomuraea phyllanthi]
MNANEPHEQGTGGWSQFGSTPPAAGGFPRTDTQILGQPLPPPSPPKKPGVVSVRKAVAGLALAATAVAGGVVGGFVANTFQPEPLASSATPSPVFKSASNQLTIAEVADKVQPSVVMIQGQTGEGSGVVLSEDGLILTNNHVVEGASEGGGQMTVKFNDGKTARAAVVGTDPATDLAVIRAEGMSGLTKATLGDSDIVRVGDPVLAIGSPLGLDGSVTAGIVSALDRTLSVGGEQRQQIPPGWGQDPGQGGAVTTIAGAIQTDASINPGNSGGALVNAAGELIGINTAIASDAAGGGVGFAIPVNTAKQVAEQLISSGKVSHAFLGVSVTDATGDVPGALIRQVTDGSPAAEAGLQQGDLITKIGNKAVDGGDTVVGQVRGFKPGQQVKITYMRNGSTHEVTVTLQEKK